MSRLFLVRHGETQLNSVRRFWGQTNVALNETGLQQAEKLRDRLASEKINAIYTSNLSRCLVTAQVIASRHKIEIITCDELKEMNFGFVEGLTFAEINRLYPELGKTLSDWKAHPVFPGGESFDALNERVHKFLGMIRKHAPDETVLIVAHNGILRLVVCNLLAIPIEHWLQMRVDPASLSIMETYPQVAILGLLNDVSHLQPNKLPGGQAWR